MRLAELISELTNTVSAQSMFSFTASIFEPLYLTTLTSAESGMSPASFARL